MDRNQWPLPRRDQWPLSSECALAHLEWALGYREAAFARSADAIAKAVRTRTDANSLPYALTWDTLLAAFDRNQERIRASATRLLEYTRTTGGVFWVRIPRQSGQ
ncbi:MAG: hypothetical protein GY769_19975 [bacterium]|nr:hypothetical protein [bacterium]